jgi:histidine ammonia-lyase
MRHIRRLLRRESTAVAVNSLLAMTGNMQQSSYFCSVIILDGNSLSIEDVARIARREDTDIRISDDAKVKIARSRQLVDEWVERGEIIYGVTTGFGEFANVNIPREELRQLQQNLLRSHSAGVGEPLAPEIVRAILLLRANALAKGCSGIRLVAIEQLLKFLAADILPVIPSRGSVGSSGDLAPLAHLALALTGEGYVSVGNGTDGTNRTDRSTKDALLEAKIEPLVLQAKEGLALINGTQMMAAIGCLALHRVKQLADIADIAGAMSFEALRATDTAFDPRIHAARPHKGQMFVAERMLGLIAGSEIRQSHRANDPRVQDAYSIRCIPQVHGAVRDTIEFVECTLAIEINSATDNPLIIPEGQAGSTDPRVEQRSQPASGSHLEGGNFHGEPLALALDYLAIALSELASISERRTERLVNGALSNGLPRFLTQHGGLNSGYMIAQYTAAALVSENKVLAHPASVDSIPTSANMEDHNSMGSIAALKLRNVVKNVEMVLAIELLCAAQGIDFLAPMKPGVGTGSAHERIRQRVPHLDEDRNVSEDIANVLELTQDDGFVNALQA